MKLAILLLLLAVAGCHARTLLHAQPTEGCEETGDCHKPRRAPYEVIGHQGASEIREYPNATWAVARGRSRLGVDIAAVFAKRELLTYFDGGNDEHRTITPSIPLITTLEKPHHHHHKPHPPHPPKNGSHPEPPHPHNGSHPHPGPHPHPHPGPHPHPHPHPGPHPGPPPPKPHGPLVLTAAFVSNKTISELPVPEEPHVKLVSANNSKVYSHKFGGFAISWLVGRQIKHLKKDLKAAGEKPCQGKFFVATYDGPWKIIGRRNEVWWTKVPHHKHHHNKTEDVFTEDVFAEDMAELFGFDQIDPAYLFPEEMDPPPPNPEDEPLPVDRAEIQASELQNVAGEWISQMGRSDENETMELN